MKYSPIDTSYSEPCVGAEKKDEVRYPTANLDVPPAVLKEIEVGETVTMTITAKVQSVRYDTEDNWGTGASVGISLRDIEISGDAATEQQSVIDSMLD
ncbi:hypothetical protein PVS_13 [Vibrio phage vB_VspS_VS-ABTNL-3]|nr:hypothetical protein PVS_13 [Vibrio phage vB_VspS_VS-ABTNL-3]